VLTIKLQVALLAIAVVAMFPGPASLLEELADWTGERIESAVRRITRPAPERWLPESADDLQFVDQGTGQFLVWYCRSEEGDYQLFKSRGFDSSGQPLKRAETQGEFAAIRAWQQGKDQEREQARRAQQDAARHQATEAFNERLARAGNLIQQDEFDEAEREAREADGVLAQSRPLLGEEQFNKLHKTATDLLAHINAVRRERARSQGIHDFESRVTRTQALLEANDFDGAEREVHEAAKILVRTRPFLEEEQFSQMDTTANRLLSRIQATRVEQAKAERERSRLASYIVAMPKERVNYIVFCVDSAGNPAGGMTSAIVDRLSGKGMAAAGDVFAAAFSSPEGFDAAFDGKAAGDVVALRLGDVADRLLLMRADTPRSTPSKSVPGVITYSVSVTVSVIDAKVGKRLRDFVISDVAGAGLTEAAAKSTFIDRFAEALATREDLAVNVQ
jgi:hypothetical protein